MTNYVNRNDFGEIVSIDDRGTIMFRNERGQPADIQGVEGQMPDFFLELMIDLRLSNCSSMREFFVAADKNHVVDWDKMDHVPRFTYYESEHHDLQNHLALLVDGGHIALVSSDQIPIYRMTENFVACLMDGWPQQRWPNWFFMNVKGTR